MMSTHRLLSSTIRTHHRQTIPVVFQSFSSASYLKKQEQKEHIIPKKKGFFTKLWDKYSVKGQQMTIEQGERLFRAAQHRAKDRTWYTTGRIPYTFRSRHAILTMHVWFVHKRLILDKIDPHTSLLVQEELFDIFWSDTRDRIRSEGLHELTVDKHVKDTQQATLHHCLLYDHAFTFEDPKRRREEVAFAIWSHVLNKDKEPSDDQICRLAMYVEWQYNNIVNELPQMYWDEGRIEWGDVPDFTDLLNNDGKVLEPFEWKGEVLPEGWIDALTLSGEKYYWNEKTMASQWEKPELE